jgi:hypothetical protein
MSTIELGQEAAAHRASNAKMYLYSLILAVLIFAFFFGIKSAFGA